MQRTPSYIHSEATDSTPGTPMPASGNTWHTIGQTSNQLILYHPPSHELQVQPYPNAIAGPSHPVQRPRAPLLLPFRPTPPAGICPYCSQPLPDTATSSQPPYPAAASDNASGRTPYFRILEQAHEGSRPPSPRLRATSPSPAPFSAASENGRGGTEDSDALPSRGYYERFFKEEARLGMGAEGSVFLATHIIGGNVLGSYAVKKIAVGESKDYLVKMLREVRLLETLRHPNIIPYHHAWIEPTRFSSFGPPINALHVLMMFATAGNLDTFLLNRSYGSAPSRPDALSAGALADQDSLGQLPKAERIKAFKRRRASGLNGKREETRGILFLGFEEVCRLFGDVVEGLAFLHSNSILHLDLKCSNVLLHWVEGSLTPRAMISDFGTSEEMLKGKRERSGHTGTMEYMAPETIVLNGRGEWRPSDSHADMWSLGMILYKMLFLHLPYTDVDDFDALQADILRYPGFIPTNEIQRQCERRHIPRDMLLLLSKLVNVDPESRPSAERVRVGLRTLQQQYGGTTRSMPSSSGVVARVSRPLANLGQSLGMVNSSRTAGHHASISPVRSPLALPSPDSTSTGISSTMSDQSMAQISAPKQQLHPVIHVLDPLLQHLEPSRPSEENGVLQTCIQRIRRMVASRQLWSWLQTALLLIKITSLQPDLLGRRIDTSYLVSHFPITGSSALEKAVEAGVVVLLTGLALYTAKRGNRDWQIAVAGVVLHLVAVWAFTVPIGTRLGTEDRGSGVPSGGTGYGYDASDQVGWADHMADGEEGGTRSWVNERDWLEDL